MNKILSLEQLEKVYKSDLLKAYIDFSRCPNDKNSFLIHTAIYMKYAYIIFVSIDDNYGVGFRGEPRNADINRTIKINDESLNQLLHIEDLEELKSRRIFSYLTQDFFEGKTKNYIPSNNLCSALRMTKLDNVKCSDIDTYNLYFEMDHLNIRTDNESFLKNISAKIIESNNKRVLLIVARNKDYSHNYAQVDLPDDDFFTEKIRSITQSGFSSNTLTMIINLIVYVTNPNEEFIEVKNEFSKNSSASKIQKNIYTEKSFFEIGHKFEFLRLISETEINVSGHWRLQPYGENRSKSKYIFIAPFIRTQKKFSESQNQ